MIARFLRELKRRRVLHTASLYVVGAWVALQVVEVLSGAGLPPSTMRNLLVILSAGFPVALVAGWFFDISKEGISRTGRPAQGETLPKLKFMDHLLLCGLIAVIVVDAWILSIPASRESAMNQAAAPQLRTVAILDFADLHPGNGDDTVGQAFADELRASLTRTAGLRVLGTVTSEVLAELAGASRKSMADELSVTAILLGEVFLSAGRMQVSARLVGPAGNEIWSGDVEGAAADGLTLQQDLLRKVVNAIAPNLDPDPVNGPRAEAGTCSTVYELYLRGKQLSQSRRYTQAESWNRGMELLNEVVTIDDQCAVAWEAIAVALEAYQTTGGFVEAGMAARRALELNDTLPEAWSVLSELAEDEGRWDDAEEYALRALRSDPTNIRANINYSINLLTRGRVREALRHALAAYRRDPAAGQTNHTVTLAAHYAADPDLIIKHSLISIEMSGLRNAYMLESIAEAHLMRGETDRALEIYAEDPQYPEWFPECVRMRDDPSLAPAVGVAAHATLKRILSIDKKAGWSESWRLIRCGTWLNDPDIFYGILLAKDVETIFGSGGFPNEVVFTNLWMPDASVMRQDPRFRELVMETGLLDYWRKWGWADLCRPDGESFQCD